MHQEKNQMLRIATNIQDWLLKYKQMSKNANYCLHAKQDGQLIREMNNISHRYFSTINYIRVNFDF